MRPSLRSCFVLSALLVAPAHLGGSPGQPGTGFGGGHLVRRYAPGWHIITGSAAILWGPATTAGGEFIVETRAGTKTPTVIPWTAHEAIVSFSTKPEGAQPAMNIYVSTLDVTSPVP